MRKWRKYDWGGKWRERWHLGEVFGAWGCDLIKTRSGLWRTLFDCGQYFVLWDGLIIRLGKRVRRKVEVGLFFLRVVLEEGRVELEIGWDPSVVCCGRVVFSVYRRCGCALGIFKYFFFEFNVKFCIRKVCSHGNRKKKELLSP